MKSLNTDLLTLSAVQVLHLRPYGLNIMLKSVVTALSAEKKLHGSASITEPAYTEGIWHVPRKLKSCNLERYDASNQVSYNLNSSKEDYMGD